MPSFLKPCFKLRRKQNRSKRREHYIKPYSDITTHITREEIIQECQSNSNPSSINANDEINETNLNTANTTDAQSDQEQLSEIKESCDTESDVETSVASDSKPKRHVTESKHENAFDVHTTEILKNAETNTSTIEIVNSDQSDGKERVEGNKESKNIETSTLKEDIDIKDNFPDLDMNPYIQKSREIVSKITVISDVFQKIEELEALESAAREFQQQRLEKIVTVKSGEKQICNTSRDTGDAEQIITSKLEITENATELRQSSPTNRIKNDSEKEAETGLPVNKEKINIEPDVYNDESAKKQILESTATDVEEGDFNNDKNSALENLKQIFNEENIKNNSGDCADNIRMFKTLSHSQHMCIDNRPDSLRMDRSNPNETSEKDLSFITEGDTSSLNYIGKKNSKLCTGDNTSSGNLTSSRECRTHQDINSSDFSENSDSGSITNDLLKGNLLIQEKGELCEIPESIKPFNGDFSDTDSPDMSLNSTISDSEILNQSSNASTDKNADDIESLPSASSREDCDYSTMNECGFKYLSDVANDNLDSSKNQTIAEKEDFMCEDAISNVDSVKLIENVNILKQDFGSEELPSCKSNLRYEESTALTECPDSNDIQDEVMQIKEKYEQMHSRIKRRIQNINKELSTFSTSKPTGETSLKDSENLSILRDTDTVEQKAYFISSKESLNLENSVIADSVKTAINLDTPLSEVVELPEQSHPEVTNSYTTYDVEKNDSILTYIITKDENDSITTVLNRLTDTLDAREEEFDQEIALSESNAFEENRYTSPSEDSEFVHSKSFTNKNKDESVDHSEVNKVIQSEIENAENLYACCLSENVNPVIHPYSKSLRSCEGYSDMICKHGNFRENEFQCDIKNKLKEIDYLYQNVKSIGKYQNIVDDETLNISAESKFNTQRKGTGLDMNQQPHTVKQLNEVISGVQMRKFNTDDNHNLNKFPSKNDEKYVKQINSNKNQDHKSKKKYDLSPIPLSSQSSKLSQGGDSKDVELTAKRSDTFTISEWGDNRNDREATRDGELSKTQNIRYRDRSKGFKYILGDNKKRPIKSQNAQKKSPFEIRCLHHYRDNTSSEEENPSNETATPKKEPVFPPEINVFNMQCGDHYITLPPILRQKIEDKIDIIQSRLNLKELESDGATENDSENVFKSSDLDEIEKKRRENIEIFNRKKIQAMSDMGSKLRVIPIKKSNSINLDFTTKCCTRKNEMSPQNETRQMSSKNPKVPPIESDLITDNANDYFQISSTESDTETSSEISEKMSPDRKRIIDISRSVRSPKYQFKINRKAFYSRKPVIVKSSKVNIVAYVTKDKNIYQGYKYLNPGKDEYKYVTSKKRHLIPRDITKRHEVAHTFIHRATSPDELRSKFDDSFRKYASRGRTNGELISYKKSTEWLRDAGIVGKVLTAEEANDVFKCIAGVKIALNKGDYRNFLKKLTRVKRLNYNEIYKRLCAAEYKCTE